jgi:hypothetical protein
MVVNMSTTRFNIRPEFLVQFAAHIKLSGSTLCSHYTSYLLPYITVTKI